MSRTAFIPTGTDGPRGNTRNDDPRRYISRHDRSRSNNRTRSDGHSREDDAVDAEECPGADAGFRDHLWAVSGIRHRFVVSKYRRPRRYGRSILDEDLSG